MRTIVITEPEYVKARRHFDEVPEGYRVVVSDHPEDVLAETIRTHRARAAILGVETYTGELYEAFDGDGILARFGVGTDGIDFEQAAQAHLVVTNTPGALDDSVAELVFWMIGNLARNVARLDCQVKSGMWQPRGGFELKGLELGLVGCGNIGQKVARVASSGFGMKVHAFAQTPPEQVAARYGLNVGQFLDQFGLASYTHRLDEMLPRCDVVSCHLPMTQETRDFFDTSTFEKFRPGACFVNTSRGNLVVEDDLYDALVGEHLGGAGLDVYRHEPYRPTDPEKDLRRLDNVVMTPHIASNTRESNTNMAELALANIFNWFEGRHQLLNRVDDQA